jgi:hypothetical protein
MTRIIADISVSLDGFVTGPDPGPDNGMGTGGDALHTWAFSEDPDERQILREATARSGAVVLGRRLFDVVDRPNGWDDNVGYGAREVGKPAFVVVTSSPPESVRLTDSTGRSSPPVCPMPSPRRATVPRRRRRTATRTSMSSSWAAAPRSARRSTPGWSMR